MQERPWSSVADLPAQQVEQRNSRQDIEQRRKHGLRSIE
jgi:hypothetical protein